MIKRSVSFCEEVTVYYIPARKQVFQESRLEEFVSTQDDDGSSLLLSIIPALLLLPVMYVLSILVQEEQQNHYAPLDSIFNGGKDALLRVAKMVRSYTVGIVVSEPGLDGALNQVSIH
mmetsp:Transcript_6830/g.9968  ORF Transcript_6830/g.9968 Transcript_6830/m.9968 type:complete len:118 (-) Transcript_6830:315-668(-)